MGIGDRLLAKTANVAAKATEVTRGTNTGTDARTSPGRLMDVQNRINAAQSRIAELELQLRDGASIDVNIDDLIEVPGRRRMLTAEQFLELKNNLNSNPLLSPVLVRRVENDKYELISGHNRTAAYRDLGRKTIKANVAAIEGNEVEFAAFYSNLLSPSLSDFEKYWNFKRLQEISGLSRSDIANSAGLSVSHVTKIFAFDALPEDSKKLLAEKPDRLGSNAALKFAALMDSGNATAVSEAIRRLLADDSVTQEQAVASATPKPKRPDQPSSIVIKSGKKKVCEVSSRNGVVGVRFFDAQKAESENWAQRISDFVRTSLAGQ